MAGDKVVSNMGRDTDHTDSGMFGSARTVAGDMTAAGFGPRYAWGGGRAADRVM